jgi:hypothetical protein
VVHLGLHGELAGGLGRRGPRLAGGTGAPGGPVKADADNRLAGLTTPRGPFDTALALGALGLLGVPIDHERVEVIALPVATLLTGGAERGPHDIDLMVGLGADQPVRDAIATVDEVRPWQQIAYGSVVLDHRPHHKIGRRGPRSTHLRNKPEASG